VPDLRVPSGATRGWRRLLSCGVGHVSDVEAELHHTSLRLAADKVLTVAHQRLREPTCGRLRHMAMTASVPMCLALLASGALSACAGETDTVGSTSGDCVSHYDFVARAPTWPGLKDAMVDSSEWGRVASVRTQARGNDVGAGDRDAVRVVDLVNRNGRRLIQVDVWRTDAGAWRAGAWSQCID
jgi:hypothetical protein